MTHPFLSLATALALGAFLAAGAGARAQEPLAEAPARTDSRVPLFSAPELVTFPASTGVDPAPAPDATGHPAPDVAGAEVPVFVAPPEASVTPARPVVVPTPAGPEAPTPAAPAHPEPTPAPVAATAHGAADDHAPTGPDYSSTLPADERATLLRLGQTKLAAGDTDAALQITRRLLASHASPAEERVALLTLARTHRARHELTRAAAVYERLLKDHPDNPSAPVVFLEVGRVHRALGAEKLAMARFYSVLHSTLKMPDEGPDDYRRLARTAQFEIAETHFLAGRYEEAERFFSRLSLLELAPEDRLRAQFKALHSTYLAGNFVKAVGLLPAWIEANPAAEDSPEARQLLAVALRRLGRTSEAFAATTELLRTEYARKSANPKRWLYWQRRTGNQIGNDLYQNGDYVSALSLYQNLATLDPDPRWALPALYQAALCYQRLGQPEQAARLYAEVAEKAREVDAPEVREVAEMAAWHLSQTEWRRANDDRIRIFFQADPPPDVPPAPADAPGTLATAALALPPSPPVARVPSALAEPAIPSP